MKSEYTELVTRVERLTSFLRTYGEKSWCTVFEDLKKQIEDENSQAVVSLSQITGGMGSFNDLAISKSNGYEIAEEAESSVNEQLRRLSHEVFSFAREMRFNRTL